MQNVKNTSKIEIKITCRLQEFGDSALQQDAVASKVKSQLEKVPPPPDNGIWSAAAPTKFNTVDTEDPFIASLTAFAQAALLAVKSTVKEANSTS